MRAQQDRQQELFSFVEIERLVPKDHLLRLIDRYVDFSFIHDIVDHLYSDSTGRPAWDPKLILRYVLIGYLYNLSDHKLEEEVAMHAAYRWFLGLSFSDRIPDRTTVIKLRTEKWIKVDAFDSIFDRVVKQCMEIGLVKATHLTVDGTQIAANASIKSLEPIAVPYTPTEYLDTLCAPKRESSASTGPKRDTGPKPPEPASPKTDAPEMPSRESTSPAPTVQQTVAFPDREQASASGKKDHHPQDKDFRGERFTNQTHRSRTDPDARLYRKAHGKESRLSFIGSFLADTKSRVILDTCAGIPGIDTESSMAVEMLDSLDQRGILHAVQILTADAHYGNTGFLCELDARSVAPHIPPLFDETPESIPQWKTQAHQPERQDKRDKRIREVHVRNRAREIVQTVGYKVSQKLRKRSEHLFAEAKGCHGLGRARGRGIARLKEQLNMTAVAQNIKRMVSFCSRMDRKKAASRLSSLSLAAAESFICRLSRSFSPFHHFILSVRALMV